jgi:hypothetical protein
VTGDRESAPSVDASPADLPPTAWRLLAAAQDILADRGYSEFFYRPMLRNLRLTCTSRSCSWPGGWLIRNIR